MNLNETSGPDLDQFSSIPAPASWPAVHLSYLDSFINVDI